MSAPHRSFWRGPLAALAVAACVLGLGLGRFGIWQPSESRMAEAARVEAPAGARASGSGPSAGAQDAPIGRPPLQTALVRAGFERMGSSEAGGRLPTALLAIVATFALALALANALDPRTGAFVGIAYATMPLVFMNARQMFGGGVAQSGFTLALAAGLLAFFGRRPGAVAGQGDDDVDLGDDASAPAWWRYGRGALFALALLFSAQCSGWMLGVAPVLAGLGIAVLVRWPNESPARQRAGVVLTALGLTVAALALGSSVSGWSTPEASPSSNAFVRFCAWIGRTLFGVTERYNGLVGAGADMRAPTTLPTYEALIEHVGHSLVPWTGIAAFGVVRLLAPPSGAFGAVGATGETMRLRDAWRESGLRLAVLCVLVLAFGLQSFHLQQHNMTAFIAAAPLAIATALLVRDAEREATQWRVVVAGATFFTLIMMRDYMLFPKSSYSAVGLPDGGPAFPTGFTGTLRDWLRAHPGAGAIGSFFNASAPGEVYFLVSALLFILVALAALFQGAGPRSTFVFARPFTWLASVERAYKADLDANPPAVRRPLWLTGPGLLAYLRRWLAGIAIAMIALGLGQALFNRALTTPIKGAFFGLAALPFVVVIAVYAVLILWNLFARIGEPGSPLMRALGTRVALVPATATVIALMGTQLFVPALSEHLSPRGVWAVIRSVRTGNEPVARYGGNQSDRAARYYADFEPTDLQSEADAVRWLRNDDPRHFMIVGTDVFPALNRAYRASFELGTGRQNIPVIDAANSNLYVAASRAGAGGSRNPLDAVVMTRDTLTGSNDHWHAHGRYENSRLRPEPARFNDDIEYVGYNLDSNGMSYVPVGGSFKITYHFRVLRDQHTNHQVFVHIDGACPRINGDHEPGGGRYPLRLWLNGDFIHDEQRITIPGYCRAGTYSVFIGFFQGDDRMRVTGGDHDRENRVVAARIVVR